MPTGAWAACGRGTDLPGVVRAWQGWPGLHHHLHVLSAIFVSLELSRSTWLVTSLSPGGEADVEAFGARRRRRGALGAARRPAGKAHARTGRRFPVVVIKEAGLDSFWIHRALRKEGVESHVVDPASITVQRRRRRAKTDEIDGEALVRALLAYKQGEPRVC